MDDCKIREVFSAPLECDGSKFYGVDAWWHENILRFRQLIEEAQAERDNQWSGYLHHHEGYDVEYRAWDVVVNGKEPQ